MPLDDLIVSRAIIDEYHTTLVDALNMDVAIVGGGPAGLVAGYYLAKQGYKVSLFERKLSIGGGMWGGGIMFNKIVLQEDALKVLNEFNVRVKKYRDNYYVADSVETVGALIYHATQAGLQIFNCMSIEDVKITADDAVCGLVVNWTSVELTNMHVDPITFGAKFVIDATGHSCDMANIILKRIGKVLFTPTGDIMGEGSMNAELAEKVVAENSREIYKNLYVTGMAANAIWGSKRMGPIFGGMLLSGKKVADDISARLAQEAVNA
ncbi:MAG: sulfide-dependent adenosine diphosphate thiazole synthase [Candidatus Auribacterota bacterium]|jgi:thiamine thiazole synthase|uniref:Thiamine thiazole synthase n=1 Tax=Candidatus Auribacter fodinae TaxID=2093366 RepID=A0A3A4R9X9_9BACT|nr:MAG: thiazole biosynthesis protein [Candidatus Auribacter fodinae]